MKIHDLFAAAFIRAGVVTFTRKFANAHTRKSGPGRRHYDARIARARLAVLKAARV